MQRAVVAGENAIERLFGFRHQIGVAQIDRAVDCTRHAVHEKQFALFGPLQHHGTRARTREQLRAQSRRQLAATRFGEWQDRQFRGFDMHFEQRLVIARDGGRGDQRRTHHHI